VVGAKSFSFYSFDFVVNTFQFPGMDVGLAMITDAVAMWTSVIPFSFNSYVVQK